MRPLFKLTAAFVTAAFALSPAGSAAPDAAELEALRAQVRALEQQLRIISRQLEIQEEAAAAAPAAKVTVADRGYSLASGDGANSIRFRGLLQLDSRLYFGDGGGIANNALVLRRARIISEGQLARDFGFQFVTDFANGVSILDANLTYTLNDAVQLKLGKFKVPVGLELLQSDSWGLFNERSLATNLVPSRDVGVQASGEVAQGRVAYAAGVFNGLPDGATSTNTDFDNDKDVAARVMFAPFRNAPGSALQGLWVGAGGSVGRQKTAAGRTAGYRTEGQQTFFSYLPAVIADGPTWRVSPQLEYRGGPFGFLADHVVSTVTVRPAPGARKQTLQNRASQVSAAYVLTGEDSSASGVVPRAPFDAGAGTWGAFELSARVAELRVDAAAFPLFASPVSSADEARSFALGLNWYLTRAAVLKLDGYHTRFGFSALSPAASRSPVLRQDENAVITRFQLGF